MPKTTDDLNEQQQYLHRKLVESNLRAGVPNHTFRAIYSYVVRRRPPAPGGFLWAVLTNDLRLAVLKADERNQEALQRIVGFIFNEVPAVAWGSEEAVKGWLTEEDST